MSNGEERAPTMNDKPNTSRCALAACSVAPQDPRIGKLTREEAMSLKAFAEAIGAADCMPQWMAREIEEKTAAAEPQNTKLGCAERHP